MTTQEPKNPEDHTKKPEDHKTVDVNADKIKQYEIRIAHAERESERLKEENLNLQREKADKGTPEDRQKFENTLKADLEGRYSKKFSELESKLNATTSELKTLKVTNVGLQKATELGFLSNAMPLIEREINAQCDLVDGKVVVKDGVDAEGKQKYKYSSTDPSKLMGLDELLAGMAKTYDFMIASSNVSGTRGSGTKSDNKTTSTQIIKPPAGFEGWSQVNQQKWFQENPESGRAYMKSLGYN